MRRVLPLMLSVIALPLLCLAGPITQVYNYEAYGNTLDGPVGTPSGPCTAESYVGQVLSLQNCTASGAGVTTSADSLATFNSLKVDSAATLTNANLPSGIFASGYARFEDFLTLQNGSEVQYLALTMHVDGTLNDSGLSAAHMSLSFGFDYEAQVFGTGICSANVTSGSQQVDMTCSSGLLPIAMFQQHPYWFSLSIQEIVNSSVNPHSGSASGDFFNTATLVSASPYDAAGNFLPDVVVSSQGNQGTPFALAPVPEPSSAAMIGLGITALAVLVRRFRSTSV